MKRCSARARANVSLDKGAQVKSCSWPEARARAMSTAGGVAFAVGRTARGDAAHATADNKKGTARLARTLPVRVNLLSGSNASQRCAHDFPGLIEDGIEMRGALEALGVDLVDVLRAGWPRGKPAIFCDDLEAANDGVVGRRARKLVQDRLSGKFLRAHRFGRQLLQQRLLRGGRGLVDARVIRRAELRTQLLVVLPRIFTGDGGDLCGQQIEDDAVLVGRPRAAVSAQEARSRALLAAETERAIEEPGDEPFEANGHFFQWSTDGLHDAIDERAADERFADGGARRPVRSVREQVADGDGQVMIRIHQPRR